MSSLRLKFVADPIIVARQDAGIKWYYHRVEWHDMNGDGFKDIVTERANGGGREFM